MKYPKLLVHAHQRPLLIDDAARVSLLKLFEQHATLSAAEFRAQREGSGRCGEKVEMEQMEVVDGVAIIPIGGPIGRGLGSFEKGAGAVDVDDVADELDQAEEDPEVRSILLDIDSPGGMVSGTPELADRILAVEKPIYAFSAGMIASAAYWLAAATDGIFATKSADIGSIGVYAPFADVSEMAKMQGVKIKVFSSGTYKGMGVPGTSLTKPQSDFLQDRVMQLAEMFYEHVRTMRGDVADENMQGQVFKAELARANGLIDDVVRDRDQVLAML
jgi:signal peptide peptidase SppA